MKYMRSNTITMNTEHTQNGILAASSVLTTSNEVEGTIEVREEKEQQGGEARKEYTSIEALRQSSPTAVRSPVDFSQLAGCVTHDVSTLQLGIHNPWANLNWQHHHSHPSKPSSSTPIQSIQHPHGIGPTKPVITFPVTMSFKRPFVHTTTTNQPHCKHPQPTSSKVPNQSPSTPLLGHPAVISSAIPFSHSISSWFLSFVRLPFMTRVLL
jgi:hypothetical protein